MAFTGRRRAVDKRVLFAILAFYAYFLQTFVVAALPFPAPEALGVICGSHAESKVPDRPVPVHRHHECCCTTIHIAKAFIQPSVGEGTVVYRQTTDRHLTWDVLDAAPKTGPPTRSTSARSPPAA